MRLLPMTCGPFLSEAGRISRRYAPLRGSACARLLPMTCGPPLSEAGQTDPRRGVLPLRVGMLPCGGVRACAAPDDLRPLSLHRRRAG